MAAKEYPVITTAHMKKMATAGFIFCPKYNSAIETGAYARLYVAPDAAEMVTKTCSFTPKGPGLRLNP